MAEVDSVVIEQSSKPREDSIGKAIECVQCASDPKYFLTQHMWLQNQNSKKIEKWQPWGYLLDLIDILLYYDLVYIVKASQLGVSWLLAGFVDWIGNFNQTAKCLLLSQGQNEAYDLLSKVAFIHENLPDYLRMPIDKDNRELISFKGNRAEIRALPSTDKAGHGYQASFIVRDELSRHEYARENFKAVGRAVDSGGKLVELSTANKKDPTNYFQEVTGEYYSNPNTQKRVLPSGLELWTNPERPKTCLVFLGWRLRPTRYEGLSLDEWFESRIRPKYTQFELEEQYPAKIEDVFKASISNAFFEVQALEDMGYDVTHPIKQQELNTFNNIVRVYKLPDRGRKYVVFTDPSDGVEDPFVTGVMDFITGEIVCSATGKERADKVAEIHDYLVRSYCNATNSFEYTGSVGGIFAQKLNELKTPSQAPRRKTDGSIDADKRGQWVSGEHKEKLMGELAYAVAKRQIVCHDREFMQQAKFVARKKSKDGLQELVDTDQHLAFDWVMMMMGLWQLSKWAPRTPYRAYTI